MDSYLAHGMWAVIPNPGAFFQIDAQWFQRAAYAFGKPDNMPPVSARTISHWSIYDIAEYRRFSGLVANAEAAIGHYNLAFTAICHAAVDLKASAKLLGTLKVKIMDATRYLLERFDFVRVTAESRDPASKLPKHCCIDREACPAPKAYHQLLCQGQQIFRVPAIQIQANPNGNTIVEAVPDILQHTAIDVDASGVVEP